MMPSHAAAAAPIVARNAGSTVDAISCDQSLNNDARPMPRTVELSQRNFFNWFGIVQKSGLDGFSSHQIKLILFACQSTAQCLSVCAFRRRVFVLARRADAKCFY